MKKSHIILPMLASGMLAISAAAFAMTMPKAEAVKAASPWSIAESNYEVAFLEQYNGGSEYGYTSDKPLLETNALGGHIYGDVGGTRKENFSTNLMGGVNETMTWKFTCGRVKNDTSKGFVTFRLETHGTTGNIMDTTKYPEGTDEYAIANLLKGSATDLTEGTAIISDGYFDELNDFSFFWRGQYATKIAVCYQIEGQEWVRISNASNVSGSRGWDTGGYSTFNSSSWTTKDAYKAKVKLALACSNIGGDHGNITLSAIRVNANNAAVRYLNALSYREGMCTADTQYDLHLGKADNRHNQDLFQLATENAEGAFLEQYTLAGTKTQAANALDMYNNYVSKVEGLGEAKVSAANLYSPATNNGGLGVFIVIGASALVAACALSITTVVIIKKKFVR